MKIIALIPVKNESKILPSCIKNLKTWVNEIVIYDDHSTDASAEVARSLGCHVITENYKAEAGWPEYEIRERLLREGRTLGGTHFVGIDADEAFTLAFTKGKEYLSSMSPGDSLSLRWITLWKDATTERIDGIYSKLYKQFIFCDDGVSHHQYAFLGVGRTPQSPTGKVIETPHDLGGVLHYQFALWNQTQIKQAWYRCSELIKGIRSARRINHTYELSLDSKSVEVDKLPSEWVIEYNIKQDEAVASEIWQYQDIIKWFDQYGIEFFEPLQIWHIPELKNMFTEKIGRVPSSKVFPKWLTSLNKLRNKIIKYV